MCSVPLGEVPPGGVGAGESDPWGVPRGRGVGETDTGGKGNLSEIESGNWL